MIVVDTNVVAYVYLSTPQTALAEKLLLRDPLWAAPVLWRSELRNVLALYLRKELLTFADAYSIQTRAEALLSGNEYHVDSYQVLWLVEQSQCSAYDCEYAALAGQLGVKLVTSDKRVLRAFPTTAVSLIEAAG